MVLEGEHGKVEEFELTDIEAYVTYILADLPTNTLSKS
jgi:hypothetical protein